MNASFDPTKRPPASARGGKIIWGVLFLFAVAIALFLLRDKVSLATLVEHEVQLRAWQREHPVLLYVLAFGLYVLVTSLSMPTVWPLSLAFGWLFGFFPAVVLVSLASTCGATIALLISRYLLRDAVERRFGQRWKAVQQGFEREGASYLFMLRLIPVVPFFLINLLAGLTRLPARTFGWVSLLGMLPGTCVYVGAGASVPSLQVLAEQGVRGLLRWQLVLALVLLATLPLAIRWTVGRWRSRAAKPAS